MDGLTTNGVLVMHPVGFPEEAKQGLWREISVCGDVYALRETRSGPIRGQLVNTQLTNLWTTNGQITLQNIILLLSIFILLSNKYINILESRCIYLTSNMI